MFRTDTHDTFLKKFSKNRVDADEYEFLTEYIAANAPITVRHRLCGTEFETLPVNMTRTRSPVKCPECRRQSTKKKTAEEVSDEVARYGNGEFTLINDDAGQGLHHLTLQHDCGYTFTAYRNNMLIWGLSCPQCGSREKRSLCGIQQVKAAARVTYLSKGRYELASEYTKYSGNVLVRDLETNEVEEMTFNGLMSRLKRMYPDAEVDKEYEQKIVQKHIEDQIRRESHGRYELRSPYNGERSKLEVYDHTNEQLDVITYTGLVARIKRLKNRHRVYEELYTKTGSSNDSDL